MVTDGETSSSSTAPDASPSEVPSSRSAHLNLRQKLAEVILSIGPVEPGGFNAFHKYKYFSDEQISAIFKDKLASRNIIIVPQVLDYEVREYATDKDKHSFLTTMKIMWTIMDGDNDEEIIAVTVGQGDDPGDKGANKAMTGAFKYFLLKMGIIGAGSDAEADERTDQRTSRARPGGNNIRVGQSNIEGVQRGGRSTNATDAQVQRIRLLAKDLELTPVGVALIIGEVLDKAVDLGTEDPGPPLVQFLGGLDAESIGKIIQRMSDMKTENLEAAMEDVAAQGRFEAEEATLGLADYG